MTALDSITLRRVDVAGRCGISRGNGNSTLFGVGISDPLCGWPWLLDRAHPDFDCEFTLAAWGCKMTARVKPGAHSSRTITELSRAALRPTRRR